MNYRKEVILQVLDYMERNILEGLSIEKVSSISGYSKWHLQRLFKHYFGLNLGTYIRNRKLSRSAILLKQREWNILDVALASGFASQQCYTRAFKRLFGETPNKFRNSRGWDFSSQIPPYNNKEIPFFYHVILPDDIQILKNYKSLGFHSIRKCRGGDEYTKINEKMIKLSRAISNSTCNGEDCFPNDDKWNERFNFLFKCHLSVGKFIVIPFEGDLSDYMCFFECIYESYLPAINIKMRENFFIELHRNNHYSSKDINVDILIPVD